MKDYDSLNQRFLYFMGGSWTWMYTKQVALDYAYFGRIPKDQLPSERL